MVQILFFILFYHLSLSSYCNTKYIKAFGRCIYPKLLKVAFKHILLVLICPGIRTYNLGVDSTMLCCLMLQEFISCFISIQNWNPFILFPQKNFLNIYQEAACYEKDILVIDKGKRSLYFGTFCILVVRCSEILNSCLLHSVSIGEEIGSICLVSGLFWRHATADLVFFSWRIVVPNCLNAYCIRDERMSCVQRACGSQHNK